MKRYSQHQIEALLDKFMDGQTTMEEEALLADYFRSHDVPDEWEDYRAMFGYFDHGMEEAPEPVQDNHVPLTRLMGRRWWGIAAAACITAAIVTTAVLHHQSTLETDSPGTPVIASRDSTRRAVTTGVASPQTQPVTTVETPHLASQTSTAKTTRNSSHATQRRLQAENAKLAKENERLQRELEDLIRSGNFAVCIRP